MCNDQISSPLYIEIRTNSARKTPDFLVEIKQQTSTVSYVTSPLCMRGVLMNNSGVCGELKRKRNNIYKVPVDVNEEIIASL